MFKDKREFLYELGNKIYIIGGCVCEECNNQKLLDEYREYKKLTSRSEFAYHPREMLRDYRNAVADSYEKIANECYVPAEKSRLDYGPMMLREDLEKQFGEEIKKQVETWVKALNCKDYRDIEHLNKK